MAEGSNAQVFPRHLAKAGFYAGSTINLGAGIKGTLGDIDPLNKVPFKRATSRVWKGPV